MPKGANTHRSPVGEQLVYSSIVHPTGTRSLYTAASGASLSPSTLLILLLFHRAPHPCDVHARTARNLAHMLHARRELRGYRTLETIVLATPTLARHKHNAWPGKRVRSEARGAATAARSREQRLQHTSMLVGKACPAAAHAQKVHTQSGAQMTHV